MLLKIKQILCQVNYYESPVFQDVVEAEIGCEWIGVMQFCLARMIVVVTRLVGGEA